MPLVVPGINSGGDDKNAQWMNKLMGKKLGDDHDQTVRPVSLPDNHAPLPSPPPISLNTFAAWRGVEEVSMQNEVLGQLAVVDVRHYAYAPVILPRRDVSPQSMYENDVTLANTSLLLYQTFAKKDLPKEHRVIESGGFGTLQDIPRHNFRGAMLYGAD